MSETYIKMNATFEEAMNFWGENWFKQELNDWNLDVHITQPPQTTHVDFKNLDVKFVFKYLPNKYLVMKTINFIESWFNEKDIFFPIHSVKFNGEFLPSYPE